jgi:hypothetical protein
MAHINSTYFNASAGKLRVVLSGEFFIGSGRDSGFSSTSTRWIIKGVVNGVSTVDCDLSCRTVEMTLDYPGGVTWSVATQTVQVGGSGSIAASGVRNLKINIRLLKR